MHGLRVPAHGICHMVLFSLLSPEVPGNWFSPYVTAYLPTQLPILSAAHHHCSHYSGHTNDEHGTCIHTKYRATPRPTMDLYQEGND